MSGLGYGVKDVCALGGKSQKRLSSCHPLGITHLLHGYGKRHGNGNGNGPTSFGFLRRCSKYTLDFTSTFFDAIRKRCQNLKSKLECSGVDFWSFATNRYHSCLEETETVGAVDFEPFPATLACCNKLQPSGWPLSYCRVNAS